MTAVLIPALGDEIVSTSELRDGLKHHLSRVREGEVLTVTSGKEEPVAILTRKSLAALIACAHRLAEIEAEFDAAQLASDEGAQEALRRGLTQTTRGEVLTPDEVRRRLGRPTKGK